MAGARGNGSGVASAGILGTSWAALTNGFPIVYCPIVNQMASLHHSYRDAVWPIPQATSVRSKATIGYG